MAASRQGRVITRELRDGTPTYFDRGRRITSTAEIARLDALAVPPAWTQVEIARNSRAKVQARGVDVSGRAQTRYHPSFRRAQDRHKYDRMLRFAAALPKLRAQIDSDLRSRGLSRDRVVACVLRLIDQEYFRVGNTEYARRYHSYGVTTLRQKHLSAATDSVTFDFIGKSGKRHMRLVRDARIARLVARLTELPGPEIFRSLDTDGVVHNVDSRHVNAYIKRYMGEEFTAKDFRTWGGTMLASSALLQADAAALATPAAGAATVRRIVAEVAERLGNTPAVTKSSYIDPRVLAAAQDTVAMEQLRRARKLMRPRRYFSVDEQCAVALLG